MSRTFSLLNIFAVFPSVTYIRASGLASKLLLKYERTSSATVAAVLFIAIKRLLLSITCLPVLREILSKHSATEPPDAEIILGGRASSVLLIFNTIAVSVYLSFSLSMPMPSTMTFSLSSALLIQPENVRTVKPIPIVRISAFAPLFL